MTKTFNVTVSSQQSHIKPANYQDQTHSQVFEIWASYSDNEAPENLFDGNYHELNSSYNICVEAED
jgi:hypothetical protein